MAIETRASSASKVEESSNSRTLRSGSGLRRSAREKQTLAPTGVKRKRKAVARVRTVGAVTRSEKSKEESVPGSSRLKKTDVCLGLPVVAKGERKVASMVQLTSETKEVKNSEVKTRYNGRSFKALFKNKKQKSIVEPNSESPRTSKTVDGQSSDVSATGHGQSLHGDDIVLEVASDDEIVSVSIEKSRVCKRKRIEAGSVDETALVSNKEADISPTDAVTVEDQSQVNRLSSDCAGDPKRQRVNDEGKQQERCYLNKQSDWDDACHKSKVDASQGSGGALHLACNPSEVEEVAINKSIERDRPQSSLNNLHCDLKPKIASLCEALRFPDDVKCITVSFLEYVMNNQYHQVASKPETGLQAFQIALCWTAASLLKYKVEHMESLELAKEQLNFGCKKEEAEFKYSMLRCLKKLFLFHHQLSKCASEDQLMHASPSRSILASSEEKGSGIQVLTASPKSLSSNALQQPLGLAHQDFSRSIKDINKKCDKQFRKLLEQQAKQREDLLKKYEIQKAQLNKKHEVDALVIRLHIPDSVKPDKLKFLKAEYAEKFEKLEHERVTELKDLEAMQSAARKNLEERKLKWVEGLELWAKEELIPRLPQKDTGQTSETGISSDVHPMQVTDAEVIHKTPSTVHVESAPVEVSLEPLASTGTRVDEQGGEILSAESESPVADQQVKVSSLHRLDGVAKGLQVEPISALHERATTTDLVDNNADGEIEEGEAAGAEEGGEILSDESERPVIDQRLKDSSLQSEDTGTEKVGLVVQNLPRCVDADLQGEPVSALPETATATGLVDNNADREIEEGEVAGAEDGGEILSVQSERPVTDQHVKDSSLQSEDTSREKFGLGVQNLPHCVDANLLGEPVSAIPETATTTGLVNNNADGEIEEGEVVGDRPEFERPVTDQRVKDSSLQSEDTGREKVGLEGEPVSAVPETATTTGLVDNDADGEIEDGEIIGAEEGRDFTMISAEVPVMCPEVSAQDDAGITGTAIAQDKVTASIPSEKDSSKELSATDSPLIQPETSITGVSSSRIDQQDAGILAGLSNGSTKENSLSVDGGEVGHQEGTVNGVHEEATTEVASAEVLDNQSDQSQQFVHTNSTPVQDGVVSAVPGSAINTEVADVADLCIDNGTGVGRESRSSEDTEVHHQDDQTQQIVGPNSTPTQDGVISSVTSTEVVDVAVPHQDGTAIPLGTETATTITSDRDNSVSSQLDSGSERVSVQNLAASTASRDDNGSGQNLGTNSTSMQPAAVSAQASPSLPNQPVQDEPLREPPSTTRANVSETVTASSASANRACLPQQAPVYRMPLPLGIDPLQNELDRVSREVDQIVGLHEKEKLQLRYDCEKEIEAVIAQICRKYEAIAKEKETEFERSKLELDTKKNKIMMNKYLADVFRSKCMDNRACKSTGVLYDAAASYMQQYRNLSSQPTYTGQRFSTPASQPNGLAANHQTNGYPASQRFPSPPPIPQLSRPLNIGTLNPTPSSNLQQLGSQFRAPAPHLQAFRANGSASHGFQSRLLHSHSIPPSTVVPQTTPAIVPPRPSHSPPMDTAMNVDARRPSSSVQQQEIQPNGAQGNEVVCLSDDD
ncbi:Helicase protein MOM1 [Linum grandiflorum]